MTPKEALEKVALLQYPIGTKTVNFCSTTNYLIIEQALTNYEQLQQEVKKQLAQQEKKDKLLALKSEFISLLNTIYKYQVGQTDLSNSAYTKIIRRHDEVENQIKSLEEEMK